MIVHVVTQPVNVNDYCIRYVDILIGLTLRRERAIRTNKTEVAQLFSPNDNLFPFASLPDRDMNMIVVHIVWIGVFLPSIGRGPDASVPNHPANAPLIGIIH